MVVLTAQKPASMGEKTMQALTHVHLKHHQMSPRQFFRASYQWKFQKDISDLALANDVKQFDEQGKVPAYVTDMLIATYGVQ